MARSPKQKVWAAKMHVVTVALTPREFAMVRKAIARVEAKQVPGWVNTKGLNAGKTSVTRFVKNAVCSAAESLVD